MRGCAWEEAKCTPVKCVRLVSGGLGDLLYFWLACSHYTLKKQII